jgi:hypothetical protein
MLVTGAGMAPFALPFLVLIVRAIVKFKPTKKIALLLLYPPSIFIYLTPL